MLIEQRDVQLVSYTFGSALTVYKALCTTYTDSDSQVR